MVIGEFLFSLNLLITKRQYRREETEYCKLLGEQASCKVMSIPIEIVEVEGESWCTVLKQMAKQLVDKGYVKESYVNALIEREKNYPTGIKIPSGINVAIPHADIEHVLRQALIIGVPKNPVIFHNIEEPKETISVELILLLVIKEPEGYVSFLSKLTRLFQDKDFITFAKGKLYKKLADLIVERCLKGKSK